VISERRPGPVLAARSPVAEAHRAYHNAEHINECLGGLDVTDRIARMIESTARHAHDKGDAAVLSDIDLAILGSSLNRFAQFEREIRREYAMFDDASHRAGRAHVLKSFLERICIYRRPRLAAPLEAQARHNLSKALRYENRIGQLAGSNGGANSPFASKLNNVLMLRHIASASGAPAAGARKH